MKIVWYWGFLLELNFCWPQNTVTQTITGTVEAIERSQMIVVVKPLSILVAVHLYSIILFADAEKAFNVFQSRRSKCL